MKMICRYREVAEGQKKEEMKGFVLESFSDIGVTITIENKIYLVSFTGFPEFMCIHVKKLFGERVLECKKL